MVTSISILYYLFYLPHLNGFQYSKWLNSSIWAIVGTLTGTTTPGQSESESNGNERALHIL